MGSQLKVEWDSHFLVGTVRYAESFPERSVLGVQLLTCSAWGKPVSTAAAQATPDARKENGAHEAGGCRQCGTRLRPWQRLFHERFCADSCRRAFLLEQALRQDA